MKPNPFNRFYFSLFLGIVLAIPAIACGGAAASTPPPSGEGGVAIATAGPSEGEPPVSTAAPAVTERRMLTLEFPPQIRAGDSEIIRLTLEVDAQGNLTATAEVQGHATQGQVIEIPNIYATHNMMAEARLDMAGPAISPTGTVSQTLRPGQKLNFYWSVLPAEVGHYQGILWFYLRFVPINGGESSVSALAAHKIEIDAVDLFGFKASTARWFGVGGTVLGFVLGLPFLEEILKSAWKKIARK